MQASSAINKAITIFQQQGGTLRTRKALKQGYKRTLYTMRDFGLVEPLCRGLYTLTDGSYSGDPDLTTVASSPVIGQRWMLMPSIF